MSYYCEITDLTRTVARVLMVHFDVKREADGSIVTPNVTRAFHVTKYDDEGTPIAETNQQRQQRFWSELQAYVDRLLADMEEVDKHFESFRSSIIGVRYPAARG